MGGKVDECVGVEVDEHDIYAAQDIDLAPRLPLGGMSAVLRGAPPASPLCNSLLCLTYQGGRA